MTKTNNPTITVELTPTTKDQEPQPKTTASNKPSVELLTIPVRPALATAANLAATTTAIAATTGTAGLALLAGTAVTGAALARHHHTSTRQQRQQIKHLRRLSKAAGLGGRRRGLGGLGHGSPRRKPGHNGGIGNHHGRKSPLGSLLRSLRSAPHHGHRSPHGATRRHPSGIGGSRTPHGSPLTRLRKTLARHPLVRAARSAAPTLRYAGKALKRTTQATLITLGALGWLIHHAYKALRQCALWLRKTLKPGEETTPQDDEPDDGPHVKDVVDDPDQQSPRSVPADRRPAMTNAPVPADAQGISPMYTIMHQACGQIAEIKHKGNMTTRQEAMEMHMIIGLLAKAIGYRCDEYRKQSLQPEFVKMYQMAQESLDAVAAITRPFGEHFDALHPERVRDLTQGTNPEGWDTHNNETIG